jgi:hypothetical protein
MYVTHLSHGGSSGVRHEPSRVVTPTACHANTSSFTFLLSCPFCTSASQANVEALPDSLSRAGEAVGGVVQHVVEKASDKVKHFPLGVFRKWQ